MAGAPASLWWTMKTMAVLGLAQELWTHLIQETGPCYVAQAGFQLYTLLLHPPQVLGLQVCAVIPNYSLL